jgi:biotin carboxylase
MSAGSILILAASTYQVPFILAAKSLGYRVLTCDNRPDNPGHALADRSANIDTRDKAGVLAFARAENINGALVAATDAALPALAHLCAALGVPGPGEQAIAALCDKPSFRRLQARIGLPHPEHFVLAPDDRVPDPGAGWIVKPDQSSGSKGIAISGAGRSIEELVARARVHARGGCVVIERFLRGSQGTIEGVIDNGHVAAHLTTNRATADPPHVATLGHRTPGAFAPEAISDLLEQIERIADQLAIEGPFDCDFVAEDGAPFILEFSPRAGGNAIAQLVEAATGFPWIEYLVKRACGHHEETMAPWRPRPAAVQLFGCDADGHLSYDAEAAARLACEPWMLDLELDVPLGAPVCAFTDGRRRVGQAVLTAASRAELDQRIELTMHALKVRAL